MNPQDTVMTVEEIAAVLRTLHRRLEPYGGASFPHSVELEEIARVQDKISHEAGEREVVDSFDEALIHSNPNTMRQTFQRILKAWRIKLKEEGTE